MNLTNLKFEQNYIHSTLLMIRIKDNNKVIGYVHKIPTEGWIWFIDATVSNQFNNKDNAINDLVQKFMIHKMDKLANKQNGIIKK
mgnify:CR=1 FL=1